ncbi:putative adenylate cyclase regulatory protein [Nymphaea thermarum]|nr:putative adenylate cyclase regulatory protein [Nymphaea thermarum]
MSELRMLRLGRNVQLKGEFEHFPKKLRWLQWCIKEDLDSLPGGLHLENIVVLDLSGSLITQLWNPQGLESTKVFGKMKVLNLAGCEHLTSCPDFERTPHLKKLDLSCCEQMSELDPSIGHLKSLTHFSLLGCGSLKTLPQEIWQLTSLEELDLSSCTEITTLPSQMEDPKSLEPVLLGKLKVLSFSYCSNLTICLDFTSMPYLEILDFRSCTKMSELDSSIGLLESLTHLNLSGCESLKTLPQEIWQLTSLQELDLSYCTEISTLPSQIEDLKSLKPVLLGKLKVLNFEGCSNLTISPDFTSMPYLEKLNLDKCKKMSELDPSIGLLESLTHLSLSFCRSLKTLPQEIWQLTSLYKLDLSYCTEITALPSQMEDPKSLKPVLLGKLKVLNFESCHNLTICPDFTSMPHLQKLNFSFCSKMSELHPSIGILKSLIDLNLCNCKSLKELPLENWQLISLEKLDLGGCAKITTLPSQLGNSKSLTHLSLRDCKSLMELPESVCQLTSLKALDLSGCKQLEIIPDVSRLKGLRELRLSGCKRLVNVPDIQKYLNFFLNLEVLNASHGQRIAFLPKWIEKLKSLTELDLSWTAIEELPHFIVSLENLEVLSVSHCDRLKFLPWFPTSLTTPETSGCGKLEDVPGNKQMKLLRGLHLEGCRSLHDSFLQRLQCLVPFKHRPSTLPMLREELLYLKSRQQSDPFATTDPAAASFSTIGLPVQPFCFFVKVRVPAMGFMFEQKRFGKRERMLGREQVPSIWS